MKLCTSFPKKYTSDLCCRSLFCACPNRSDVIQRKFTITKALLFKADRSSFDRLRQQVGNDGLLVSRYLSSDTSMLQCLSVCNSILSFLQIYKLELEQKRLEEDAFVYNWLQKQLKLSPAYKKVILVI